MNSLNCEYHQYIEVQMSHEEYHHHGVLLCQLILRAGGGVVGALKNSLNVTN